MKIKKITIAKQNSLNKMEIVKTIEIGSDHKGILFYGKNQTGKTTYLYFIEALFGYQYAYIRNALNIDDTRMLNLFMDVANDSDVDQILFRNFSEKADFKAGSRPQYSNLVEIRQDKELLGKMKFLNYYFMQKGEKIPQIMNINSNFIIDSKLDGDLTKEIDIADYSRLFIHSQNPEILSGVNYYSNTIKMLFTFIKLTTGDYDEKISEIVRKYLEEKENKSWGGLLKNIEKNKFNRLTPEESRAVKILASKNSGDIFDKKKNELWLEIISNQKKISKLFSNKRSLVSKSKVLSNRINELSEKSKLKEYAKVILLDDTYDDYYQTKHEIELQINNIDNSINEMKKRISKLKEEIDGYFKSKFDTTVMDSSEAFELIKDSYAYKEIKNLNTKTFDLTSEIKKIENDFFKEHVKVNIESFIDEITNEISNFKSGEDFELNVKMLDDLKKTNFKIFDSSFSDDFRPQGAMLDTYYLMKIYLYAKAIDSNGGKIPFVVIDTPFRNENVGFFKDVPNIIMRKITEIKGVENIFIATATKEDFDVADIPLLKKHKLEKDDVNGFSAFKK